MGDTPISDDGAESDVESWVEGGWQEAIQGEPPDARPVSWEEAAALGAAATRPDGTVSDASDIEHEAMDGTFAPASNTAKKALIVAAGLGSLIVIAVLVLLFNGDDPATEAANAESLLTLDAQDDCGTDQGCTETQPTEVPGAASDAVTDDCPLDSGCDARDEGSALQGTLSGFVSDAVGDLDPAYSDLDPIDGGRTVDGVSGDDFMTATDVTGLEVNSNADGGETTIALTFNGAARDVQTEEQGNLTS